jgi:hypothetical protein
MVLEKLPYVAEEHTLLLFALLSRLVPTSCYTSLEPCHHTHKRAKKILEIGFSILAMS